MTPKEGWQGVYGIQVYNAKNVTLNDVSSSGADGGILVNGSEVTLTGIVEVSGNESGGIEVSKGEADGIGEPKLTVNGTVTYTEETETEPVIWIDGYDCTGNSGRLVKNVVKFAEGLAEDDILNGRKACVDDNHQYFFHTDAVYVPDNN
ncbi:hypothetical protein GCM10008921_16770 [Metaclostridioides mangenotii]